MIAGNWTILVLVVNGRVLTTDFIGELPERDRSRVGAFLSRVCETGPPRSIESFRKLDEHIWELKSSQVRLLCFFDGVKRMIITNGFLKQQPKLPRAQLQRANRLRAEFLETRRRGEER